MSDARRLIDKLIAYRNVLRDASVGVIEYTEQLTYLLFLKMAHERATRALAPRARARRRSNSSVISAPSESRIARGSAWSARR